ncbi:MAG: hypothetical protein AAF492_20750, partial [Verrucomicrobiota bacterium]
MDSEAGNPFLALETSDPVTEAWAGIRWCDETGASPENGSPIRATVTIRKVAEMSWGRIIRYRFDCEEREVPALYYLVRDNVILELVSDDMEFLIGRIAAMKNAPHFESTDVRALSEPGEQRAKDGPWTMDISSDASSSTYRAHHNSGHFAIQIFDRRSGLVEYSMGYGAGKEGFRLQKRPFSFTESIGSLQLGDNAGKVLETLSADGLVQGPNEYWGADGAWHQDWSWPKQGISLDMISEDEDGPKRIVSIEIQHPSVFRT